MKRMKTFGMYLLWFVLLYMFVTVSAYGYIEASYKGIDGIIIKDDKMLITIDEAEATIVNGQIKGQIKNISQEDIGTKYIKIDLISKKGTLILTKYIQVDELKAGEQKEFNLMFRAENIVKYQAQITDKAELKEGLSELVKIGDLGNDGASKIALLLAAVILIKHLL
ncbi:MAG: FxLYD domain-containing protein [Clostridium sp.]|nr:FxLYD domain-containing protein [Clostridium sp.]